MARAVNQTTTVSRRRVRASWVAVSGRSVPALLVALDRPLEADVDHPVDRDGQSDQDDHREDVAGLQIGDQRAEKRRFLGIQGRDHGAGRLIRRGIRQDGIYVSDSRPDRLFRPALLIAAWPRRAGLFRARAAETRGRGISAIDQISAPTPAQAVGEAAAERDAGARRSPPK